MVFFVLQWGILNLVALDWQLCVNLVGCSIINGVKEAVLGQ
jgi:hypothetical protein